MLSAYNLLECECGPPEMKSPNSPSGNDFKLVSVVTLISVTLALHQGRLGGIAHPEGQFNSIQFYNVQNSRSHVITIPAFKASCQMV